VRILNETSLTQSWLVQGPGTPFFSSPEQLVNDKHLIDWRSDQFSLGVVIAFCVFGFHPYAEGGCSDAQAVERVARRSSASSRFVEAANSCGLPTLVRMTYPWPVQRIRTPEELWKEWHEQRGANNGRIPSDGA
jgi:serine/threonine protein kinase